MGSGEGAAGVQVELTVSPFVEGRPGPHVRAAQEALAAAGLVVRIEPFATAVSGGTDEVLAGIDAAVRAALAAGASSIALDVRPAPAPVAEPDAGAEAFLLALAPVVEALGGQVLAGPPADGDVPVTWEGATVAAVRPSAADSLQDALPRLIAAVEADLGAALADLDREGKQQAARLLEERGAFTQRNAAETVADAMGVSRVTVYNYLAAIRQDADREEQA